MDVKSIRIGQGVKCKFMGIVTGIDGFLMLNGQGYSIKVETDKGTVTVKAEHLEPYDEHEK